MPLFVSNVIKYLWPEEVLVQFVLPVLAVIDEPLNVPERTDPVELPDCANKMVEDELARAPIT